MFKNPFVCYNTLQVPLLFEVSFPPVMWFPHTIHAKSMQNSHMAEVLLRGKIVICKCDEGKFEPSQQLYCISIYEKIPY